MGNMGTIPATGYESSVVQTFSSPTGTSHTMTYTASVSDMILVINNVIQEPTVAYTTSGTTLTTGTLVSSDTMYIVYLALTRQTVAPGADTVTNAMIVDNAIDSEHYTDASIDLAHMSADSVDSSQYVDGSIDLAHIANNAIDETKLKDALIGDFSDVTVTAADAFLYGDATASGNTKKDTIQGILDLASSAEISIVFSTLDISLSNGTGFSVTGAGFTPTACIMSCGITGQQWWNISFIKASAQHAYSYDDANNDEDFVFNALAGLIRPSGSDQQSFSFTSFDADGITLNNAKYGSPTGTASISWVFFK